MERKKEKERFSESFLQSKASERERRDCESGNINK